MSAWRSDQAGFAIPVAVIIGMVAMILMATAVTYSVGRVGDHERRRDRVTSIPVVDSAVTRIKFGLEQNLLAEHRDYVPTVAHMDALVKGTDLPGPAGATEAELVPGSPITPGIPVAGPFPMPQVTVRERSDGPTDGFWQLLRVFPPDYDDVDDQGAVVAYIRTWVGRDADPSIGSEPRLVRVEFRPGRFADYQAVIDGPIIFGPGATLNGPIHSNGFPDERANFVQALVGKDESIGTSEPSVKVTCSADAQITTAQGNVETAAFPGCPVQVNTKRYVNLLATEEAFGRIRKACNDGATNVVCHDKTLVGSSVPSSIAQKPPDLRGYRVELSPGAIKVSGYEIGYTTEAPTTYSAVPTKVYTPAPDGTLVLYFADSVIVSGTTDARVTIAARKPGLGTTAVEAGAANIYVNGNLSHEGDGSVLGLMAQGGVILDAVKQPSGTHACVSHVRAAMVAMAGTLTIDPRYTTKLYQQGGPACGPIEIEGSLVAHRSPVLVWEWANVAGHAGYSKRTYTFDEDLRRNPPPYFPTTDTWEARHVRPANLDCFTGGNITDQDC